MTAWVEIDNFLLTQNAKAVRRMVGESFLWANVSHSAYGHDLAIAAEAFWRGGVDGFVVTNSVDASWLSKHFKLPVLVLLPLTDPELAEATAQNWHLAVTSQSYFERIAHYARTHRKLFRLHYELDTGGNTTGVDAESLLAIFRHQADMYSMLVSCGLFTHVITPNDNGEPGQQLQRLQEFQFNLQREGFVIPPTHALTSSIFMEWCEGFIFDGVRMGGALYGMYPEYPGTIAGTTVKTRVITTRQVKAGESVGFRPRALLNKVTRIAVIQVGTNTGLDRRIREKGQVLIRGRRCSYVGGIGRDLAFIDITGLASVGEGEEVVILGNDGKREITIPEIEDWIGLPAVEWLPRLINHLPHITSKTRDTVQVRSIR